MIRAYLRASTREQDASRAEKTISDFLHDRDLEAGRLYIENESGTQLHRPELIKLINQAKKGDVLLVEQVDRLSRLNSEDWEQLKQMIHSKGLKVVSLDLPTSWMLLEKKQSHAFMDAVLKAINGMMLDMLAAFARKDQEDRKRRQREGIARAREEGKYLGKKPDLEKHTKIRELRKAGISIRKTADIVGCSKTTVINVMAQTVNNY